MGTISPGPSVLAGVKAWLVFRPETEPKNSSSNPFHIKLAAATSCSSLNSVQSAFTFHSKACEVVILPFKFVDEETETQRV